MDVSLIWDGIKMMVIGMGMVYVFLIVMIYCMKGMGKALAPYANFLAPAAPQQKRNDAVDPASVAAAGAAMHASKK